MRSRTARIVLFVLALVVPVVLAACGSSSSSSGGSSSADPQQILDETFNNNTKVTSGNLNLSFSLDATGSQSASLTASLVGPFQGSASDPTTFPQLDLSAKVSGSGGGQSIDFQGGVTATNDAAFISYNGTDYAVPAATFQQFKSSYASQTQAAGTSSTGGSSVFKNLGIDPSTWLTNVTNQGTADVEGETTDHIAGDADVQKILTDLSKAIQSVPGASTSGISPSQFQQASQYVKSAHIDVYSGTSDHVLRKLEIALDIQPPAGSAQGVSDIKLDLSIAVSNVNQTQTITAPTNTKPLSDLQQQLGGLGILGQLGGTTGSSSSSVGTATAPTGGASGAPSSAAQAKYVQCVTQAAQSGDPTAANKCLALLK